jgi:EmrB/QacA subfamily drug resistance transporter
MQLDQPYPTEARADRHLIFALLSASLLTFIMQFGMVTVALRQLTTDLAAPLRWSGWVLTIFMVGQVIAMPVAGRLAERFGARLVFAGGLAAFAVASLACAFAPNVYVLIAARVIQGAAGGGLMPAGISLIGEAYGAGRTSAIGFFSSLIPFGAVLGPVVGGVIVDHFGWRWTFGVSVPMGVVACVASSAFLPVGHRKPMQRIDFLGVGLIALTIVALVFALTELGQRAVSPNYALVGIATVIFAISLIALVWHETRTPLPVVDLDLLRRWEFASSNALAFCFGTAWIGVTSLIPLFAQSLYGMTAGQSGALIAPRSLAMVTASGLAAWAMPRTGFRKPLAIGLVGTALMMLLLGRGLHDPTIAGLRIVSFWWNLLVIGGAGVFFGFANPSMNNAALHLAPDRIASIAGLRGMFQSLGGTIGIAVAVLIASRAESTAAGLQLAFTAFAVILAASSVFVLGVPELPGRRKTTDRAAKTPAGTHRAEAETTASFAAED